MMYSVLKERKPCWVPFSYNSSVDSCHKHCIAFSLRLLFLQTPSITTISPSSTFQSVIIFNKSPPNYTIMSSCNERFDSSEKSKSSSMFNRSITMAAGADFSKPLYRQSALERRASMKKICTSGLDSVLSAGTSIKGKVKKLCSLFESPKSNSSSTAESKFKSTRSFSKSMIGLPGTEDRVVVYFTSLRGIRRTYEDCYAVRLILKGFRVMVDERDISMDLEYKSELQRVLGQKSFSLPQVFIRGEYIGGADLIKHMVDVGELAKMLKGLPIKPPGYVCEFCGDARFVPCTNCSGSKKIFDDEEDQLQRCPECNENGLIRCPTCCS